MKEYLSTLNPEQFEAATTIDGSMLVLAGAGAGKTHTMITRVAHMIEEGVNPRNILLLTFTNKAANEMKERIINWLFSFTKENYKENLELQNIKSEF